MKLRTLFWLGLATALAAACGGNVVFVEDGGEGDDGDGGEDPIDEATIEEACEKTCTVTEACVGGSGCSAACPLLAQATEQMGCGEQLIALLDCLANSPDPCNPSPNDCMNELTSYGFCFGAFCTSNPDDPACDFGGGF